MRRFNTMETTSVNGIEICLIEDLVNEVFLVTTQKQGCGMTSNCYDDITTAFCEFLNECDDAREGNNE